MTDNPSVSVIVPATTANLGCAFDCAGIALSLYLRATATPQPGGFTVAYSGPNAAEIPSDESNLIVKAMRHFAATSGANFPCARVEVENEIPLGVGLGSSASAIVAGILLASGLSAAQQDASAGPDRNLAPARLLELALQIESHPDNIAAAVHGGMVVAAVAGEPKRVLVSKAVVSSELDFVAVVPEVPLPTEKARAVLPLQYSRTDVVANLQRTALLTAAFFSGTGLVPELFHDRLHQPYRSPLVPGIAECLAFRHESLAGIFLSGAGSAVMAIARKDAPAIGEALVGEFRKKGIAAKALLLKADNVGAQLKLR